MPFFLYIYTFASSKQVVENFSWGILWLYLGTEVYHIKWLA